MNILTKYDPKPIPGRIWDWQAWVDGRDEPGEPMGYGPTREAAIADLRIELELVDFGRSIVMKYVITAIVVFAIGFVLNRYVPGLHRTWLGYAIGAFTGVIGAVIALMWGRK